MKKRNENCQTLEQQALLDEGIAMEKWHKHTEVCDACLRRKAIVEKLARVREYKTGSLGAERFEKIRLAVAGRKKQETQFPILKYVALFFVMLTCALVYIEKFFDNQVVVIQELSLKSPKENTELAWDYKPGINSLRYKVSRIKKELYFSEIRNKNGNGFQYRCQSIKKETNKLRNEDQI